VAVAEVVVLDSERKLRVLVHGITVETTPCSIEVGGQLHRLPMVVEVVETQIAVNIPTFAHGGKCGASRDITLYQQDFCL
ncbi:hypothetical protein, partial [Anaplasma platys]|uniref:hypothetical protein n=1 Tax=Anaplasma platys TaxID=949 RepID=UPI001F296940